MPGNLRIPSPEAQTLALTAYDGMLRNPNTRVRPARLTEAGLAHGQAALPCSGWRVGGRLAGAARASSSMVASCSRARSGQMSRGIDPRCAHERTV